MADRILRVGGCSGFLRRRSAGAPSADEDEVADAACLEEILGDTMSFAVDLLEARPGDTAAALAQAAAGLPRHGLVRLACGDRPLAPSETLAEAGVLDGAAVFAAVRSEEAFWRAAREELLERREEGLSQPCLGPADGGRLVATVGELCQAFEAGGQLDRVLALLGQALALLQAGASTEAFQSFRGYNGYGDVEGDGHNLACLFRHCVLAIDGLFAEGAAGAARLLRSCAELFEALVVAPGTAVRDNSCGIPVEYYHNYEGLLGTVSEMCRALFRHGGFVDPAHCHIVSFRPRQVYRPVETAAALGFAWRVLELQLLVEGEGPELTVPRRSCSLYPRVACLDLFYSVVDAETAELPPVAISPLHRQLRERAARLAVFCGRAEAIAEDVARLRRWHASANGCQFFLGNRPQWNEGDWAMLDFPALLRALEAAARASAGAVEEEELEAEMLRFLGRDGAEGEAVGPAGDDPLTFLLLKSFGRAGGATACARAFGALAPLQRRALLRAAPAFLFELVRRRQRRQLELLLGLEPRLLAALRQRGEDLLVWACRQRGLTHGIVKALLRSGVFPAGEALPLDRAAEGSESPRHRARLAAFRAASSVRNRHVLAILAEAWPEVESPKPAGSGGGLSAFRTPPVVADAGEAG